MQQCQVSLKIDTTNPAIPLGVEVWLDQDLIADHSAVTQAISISHALEDVEGSHELRVVLKNKQSAHTKIDTDGNILSDATLVVSDVMFDQVSLGQILIDQAIYTHNYNGQQEPVQQKFYGEMGCNGTVSLRFTTPVYVWLLENM
jgi:hypothetical protein